MCRRAETWLRFCSLRLCRLRSAAQIVAAWAVCARKPGLGCWLKSRTCVAQPPARGKASEELVRCFWPPRGSGYFCHPGAQVGILAALEYPHATPKPRHPSLPRPARAGWTSSVALGPPAGCAELYFARGVRASSVHISHPHPWLSPDQLFGRFWAILKGVFQWCQTLQKALGGSRKEMVCRRAGGAEGWQKPPDCQCGAGSAAISTIPPFAMLEQ